MKAECIKYLCSETPTFERNDNAFHGAYINQINTQMEEGSMVEQIADGAWLVMQIVFLLALACGAYLTYLGWPLRNPGDAATKQ